MNFLSRFLPARFIGLYLSAILLLFFSFPSGVNAQASVPASFQNLYTALNNDLDSFNTTLNSKWNGVKYPVLFTANLWNAGADGGPQMVNPGYIAGVQTQLMALKAMGVQGVTVEVGFPMLYAPFFSSQTQYQQFVTFYQNVATNVRAAGLKLIVDNETLRNNVVFAGWNTAPFYASLNWTEYQAARAQTAVTIAQTMQPDYMVVLEEPDTEAIMTGQVAAGTVSGSTGMLSQIISTMQAAGVSGVQVGAGVGTWLPLFQQFIQSFVALPVNFIDMHVLPVNDTFLPNALTIASMAATAGKPVTMTQTWLRKVRYSDLTQFSADQLAARNPFSFWAPLDAYFLQTMENMAYYTQMAFMDAFESIYLWSYLPYDSSTQNLSPSAILSQANQQGGVNMLAASYTSTAMSYYSSILPAPDTAPPSAPTNLKGSSTQTTEIYLTWNASTDDVGVAGYYVFRNGVKVGTTAPPSYVDTGLTDGTTYSYFVEAFDLAGNVSAPSLTVTATTWNTIPPSTPANVVATAVSTQQISLTWSASTDTVAMSSYRVFRGTSASNLTQVGSTYSTTTSYMNYPLSPSTTYYFGVEAVDTDGNLSPMSAIVPATTLALPSPPLQLIVSVTATQIELTWTAGSSGMSIGGFTIFRGTSPSNLTQVATRTATTFTDYPLAPASTYYYAVEETDKNGNVSPMSAVVSATTLALPSAPAMLVATPISTVQIGLTWTAGPSGMPIGGYTIFRGTSRSNLTQVATRSTTTLTDYPLVPGTTYYYAVEETDNGGNVSPMSTIASAATLALPSAPAHLVATPVSTAQIGLTWTAGSSGMPITGYYIFRGTTPSNLAHVAGTGTTTAYTDHSLTPSTTYYYAVESVDSGGNVSPMSAPGAAATLALPTAPAMLIATPISTAQIGLTWTAGPSGMPIAGYTLFRGTARSGLTQLVTLPSTTFTDYPLTPGTTYFYAVEETDKNGNVSPMSAVVSAATLALPSAPAMLVATPISTAQIGLTWTAGPSGMPIGGYTIFRGTAPSSLTQLVTLTSTTFTDYPLTPGTTYYYAVEETDKGGNVSPMSAVASAATLALPTAPAKLTATPISTAQIGLSWTAGPSGMPVAGYTVFRGPTPSSLIQLVTLTSTAFTDYPLTPGVTYYYAVEETDKGGNVSPMSVIASAATFAMPTPPVSLVATPVSAEQIGLTWTGGPSGMPVAGYTIFRGTSPSNLTQVATRTGAAFNDYPLTPGTTYYYAVEETDTLGNVSPMSAVVSATTPTLP